MTARSVPHDHSDKDVLRFGCAGCIDRVRRDQFLAALEDLPLRTLTVDWIATASEHGKVVLEVHAGPDEDAADVAERHLDEINDSIALCVSFMGDYDVDGWRPELGDTVERSAVAPVRQGQLT